MSDCPSLTELRLQKNEQEIRQRESRIRAEARSLGVSDPDDNDLWALLHRVNRARDEFRRPETERRAERLGIPTKDRKGRPREVWEISYDCFQAEDRERLCRELGYTP